MGTGLVNLRIDSLTDLERCPILLTVAATTVSLVTREISGLSSGSGEM
jgi:hypothetical protein